MKYLILIVTVFSLNSISFSQQNQLENAIESTIIPLRENSFEASKQFSFIDKYVVDKEIVMLGEQTHGDGSTFRIKSGLIKYLHEKHNFEVIVFESGLRDAFRVWNQIQSGQREMEVFDYGILPIWTRCKQAQPLFEYILENADSSNPLIVAGMDIQPTGPSMTPDKRLEELTEYLTVNINYDSAQFHELFKALNNYQLVMTNQLGEAELQKIYNQLFTLSQRIEQQDKTNIGQIYSRYLLNLSDMLRMIKNSNFRDLSKTPHALNIRDRGMAENLIFLKEKLYPNKKIMVWGANSHLGFGRGYLQHSDSFPIDSEGMVPMGEYLKIDYLEKVYAISFTSYSGKTASYRGKSIIPLEPAAEGSIESKLHKRDIPYAFFDLNSSSWDSLRFLSRIFGHSEINGLWAEMTDAIFYIDEMEEAIYDE